MTPRMDAIEISAKKPLRQCIDRDVAQWETIIVHPNVNTTFIPLSTADLLRFLAARGNCVTYIDVAARDTEN